MSRLAPARKPALKFSVRTRVPLRPPIPFLLGIAALAPLSALAAKTAGEIREAILASPRQLILSGLHRRDDRDGLQRWVGAEGKPMDQTAPILVDPPSDEHTFSFFQVRNLIIEDCTLEANIVEEALKFTHCNYVWVRDCTLIGGSEDALDIVKGANYLFENVRFVSRGARAVTIKGGAENIHFTGCTFSGTARGGAFLEIGDWTDYDQYQIRPTRRVWIDDTNTFESPHVPVNRGSLRRRLTRPSIRPVRAYYAEDLLLPPQSEVLPPSLMPAYFALHNLLK